MENTIYGKRSKDSNMKMKLDDQAQTYASTRTSNGPPKALLMFLVPLLAIGSILCIVFGISNSIGDQSRAVEALLWIFAGFALMALLVFLIASKISGSYERGLEPACASFTLAAALTAVIFAIAVIQHQNKIENIREEFMSEQGYENLDKRGKSTYYADKDGKEYLLIVDKMKDDGEMKVKVTSFEKESEEVLN